MRLKTRFTILVTGAMLVVALMGALEIRSALRTQATLQQVHTLDQRVQELFQLQVISSNYAEYPSERARRQWYAVFHQLSRGLDRAWDADGTGNPEETARLAENLRSLRVLFGTLEELDYSEGAGGGPATRRVRTVLTSQIHVTEQAMVADLQRWHDQVYEEMWRVSVRLAIISSVLLLTLTGVLIWARLMTQRMVLGPVRDLQDGMEQVAAGDLGFRFNSVRTDELGELARTFDAMTDQLQDQIDRRDRTHALLQQLVEAVPDAIYVKDPRGRYLLINVSGAKLTGRTPEGVIGNTDWELFQPESAGKIVEDDRRIMGHGETESSEEEVTDRHGSSKAYIVTKGSLHDDTGQVLGLFGISTDITDRVKAETEIRRLNHELDARVRRRTAELEAANEELESFAYSVSHDLRAPLRSIDGFSRILFEEYAHQLPEEGRHYLERVKQSARKMDDLIQHLLSFSRLSRQPLQRRLIDITAIAEDAWTEVSQQGDGQQIEIVIKPLPSRQVDPKLLSSVFSNLLGNAVKYSKNEGHPRIEVGVKDGSDPPVIYVADNGAGFDMAYADKVFDVFQRLHSAAEYPGTGIGLATVQRIIHRHGGKIWVESEEGTGATFFFTLDALPLAESGSAVT